MHEIYYVTCNPGKFNDVKMYIESHCPEITIKQYDIDIEELQSTSQEKIALDKAKQAHLKLGKPVLVDDSGVYFDAYKNFPGTMTKFVYQGIGTDGILKLVEDNNKASFILTMVYMDDKTTKTFQGRCDGKIVPPTGEEKFAKAFPWNPIFMTELGKTYAQLSKDEKHSVNYRVLALKKFLEWYAGKVDEKKPYKKPTV